jgi:hypothetical protein
MTMTTTTDKVVAHDSRSYFRIALAVAAPLPMLAMGAINLIQPFAGDEEFDVTVAKTAANLGAVELASWLSLVFFACLVPAALAVVAATRRATPRLAAWGGTLTVVGFGLGLGIGSALPSGAPLAYLTAEHDLDLAAMEKLNDASWSQAFLGVGMLFWVVGLTVGLGILGVALWRSRVVAPYFGIALLVGGPTHPFIPGHLAIGIGLLVAAFGFAGASVALLRMDDDDFLVGTPGVARAVDSRR